MPRSNPDQSLVEINTCITALMKQVFPKLGSPLTRTGWDLAAVDITTDETLIARDQKQQMPMSLVESKFGSMIGASEKENNV